MDCRTAEGMVSSYIKHDLPLNELEEFLDHVQNCSSCYDELETYFIVHEVTQQLDDDSSDSVLDFKKLLEQDISARSTSPMSNLAHTLRLECSQQLIREYDLFIRFLTATPRQRQEEERASKVNRDKVQKKGLRL